jgi:hypothetical protein
MEVHSTGIYQCYIFGSNPAQILTTFEFPILTIYIHLDILLLTQT